jgi:DNA-binding NarL/FixJ family response regulator
MRMTSKTPGRLPILQFPPAVTRAGAIVTIQAAATLHFVIDGFDDVIEQLKTGPAAGVLLECAVALILATGVAMGIAYVVRLAADLRRADDALTIAKGALAQHVERKFGEWKLSTSEAEVGLFALKGFPVAEIARLRGSASGTVRSQLS